MPQPIIPWIPYNIPTEIVNEWNRRKNVYGLNYQNPNSAGWDSATGDWKKYQGPMSAWTRISSNGFGRKNNRGEYDKKGFIWTNNFNVYDDYGISNSKQSIIGKTHSGEPHFLDYNLNQQYPINVPPPLITSIEFKMQKEMLRFGYINWTCFSFKQLEYMTPYFMVPKITVMIEFGWNHFNPISLIDITNLETMESLWKYPYPAYADNPLKSNGNYDVIYGIISNWNWSYEGGKFVCQTEITSKDRIYAGISAQSPIYDKSETESDDEQDQDKAFGDFKGFFEQKNVIDNIKTYVKEKVGISTPPPSTPPRSSAPATYGVPQLAINSKIDAAAAKEDYQKKSKELDFLKNILDKIDEKYTVGCFWGRIKEDTNQKSKPQTGDFDRGYKSDKLWANMGLIIEIINHFSETTLSNKTDSDNIFKFDISEAIIGGHPNLISTDSSVLIPNPGAPKYHYGLVGGVGSYNPDDAPDRLWGEDPNSDYDTQKVVATPVVSKPQTSKQFADKKLKKCCLQPRGAYRDDLNKIINYLREKKFKEEIIEYAFPQPNGITNMDDRTGGYCGYLKNIYFEFGRLKNIVSESETFLEIIEKVLQILNESTDHFWNLRVVSSDKGYLTVKDNNYINSVNKNAGKPCVFDLNDVKSVIKSVSFRPSLSPAQATRAILSETNNTNSSAATSENRDFLNYEFEDMIMSKFKTKSESDKKIKQPNQLIDILRNVQKISDDSDETLQMTFVEENPVKTKSNKEYIKLVLTDKVLLRFLLNDGDVENNQRYYGIQPNITAEILMQGTGGLRTFQHFFIRNLPEPYSIKNIVFRITDVQSTIQNNIWETKIVAGLIPLRGYIINALGDPNL